MVCSMVVAVRIKGAGKRRFGSRLYKTQGRNCFEGEKHEQVDTEICRPRAHSEQRTQIRTPWRMRCWEGMNSPRKSTEGGERLGQCPEGCSLKMGIGVGAEGSTREGTRQETQHGVTEIKGDLRTRAGGHAYC